MSLTTDRNDPRLRAPASPGQQNEVYLVLSAEERVKGFIRPVRHTYQHVGLPEPKYALRDLTDEEHERYDKVGYVKYEPYAQNELPFAGRFYKQSELDRICNGCGTNTSMGNAIAETYARDPQFYGSTFCASCGQHFAVGARGEFVWTGTNERVGT